MYTEQVLSVLKNLQNQICAALEAEDGSARFEPDEWQSKLGTGQSRVLKNGVRSKPPPNHHTGALPSG